jgi:hypothetical protein
MQGMSIIIGTIPIETTKTSGTSMAGTVANLLEVVCTHGMRGHFLTINRLLLRNNFHLEVCRVFEILCSYNIGGKNSISRCIG